MTSIICGGRKYNKLVTVAKEKETHRYRGETRLPAGRGRDKSPLGVGEKRNKLLGVT